MTDQPSEPKPTLLCRAWAAFRLLEEGRANAAEDELAAAFGYTIRRIEHEGRLLAKIKLRTGLTTEREAAAYDQMLSIIDAHRGRKQEPTP